VKIAILLGSAHVGGGTYVIFQHALFLARAGWDVTIVGMAPVEKGQLDWHPEAKAGLVFKTFDDVATESFDIAMATWWRTAYWLHRVKARSYQYFVQSIESRFFESWDLAAISYAESTYSLQLPVVTEARWIKGYLAEKFHTQAQLAPNGIRKDLYAPQGPTIAPRDPSRLRILVEGPLRVFFKNVEKTVELCKKSRADEIWLLTSSRDCMEYPGVDRTFSCIPITETPSIYRSCDVIIKLSYVEGMFGPPLEMFHCGGTAIVYDVTGHDEYICHGENALVLRKDDEEGVIQTINSLKDDPTLLSRLKRGALDTSEKWPDWQHSSARFLEAVRDNANLPSESQVSVRAKSIVLTEWYEKHLQMQQAHYQLIPQLESARAESTTYAHTLSVIYNSRGFRLIERLRSFLPRNIVTGLRKTRLWRRLRSFGVKRG
jgi:glycosyltransferase involved in cell wall biosynthesis